MNIKCFECKQTFPREQMTFYQTPQAKSGHYYCPKCLEERHAREQFADKVCEIFGLKAPGPRIWAERKRIKQIYGYDDQTIIDCLDYLYQVKKMKFWSESIYLVTPEHVEEMRKWQHQQREDSDKLLRAANQGTNYRIQVAAARIKEREQQYNKWNNPDEWIE